MSDRSRAPTPSQIARSERMRLTAIESAKAMAEIERERSAKLKNMERLRALRLARDAELAATPQPAPGKTKPKKATKAKA